jgi:hypothetical protein
MFEIDDRYLDPADKSIGTITGLQNDRMEIRWHFPDGGVIVMNYKNSEFNGHVLSGLYLKLANINKIWKELNQ